VTEAEWLSATDPESILDALGGVMTDRQRRLFGCACCRRVWHLLPDERYRRAVEVAERLADGRADEDARAAAHAAITSVPAPGDRQAGRSGAARAVWYASGVLVSNSAAFGSKHAAKALGDVAFHSSGGADWDEARVAAEAAEAVERAAQVVLLRDISGNPFRPVASTDAWRTPTAVALVQAIYEESAFDRLPILADALEDAGCTDRTILDHCRGPGPHVRGCWVVDRILGKE
jgi:hypothetical protein